MDEVAFYFDFGSPNAYLAHRLIPAIEARSPIRFAYVPVLLGGIFKLTNNQSPMTAFAGVKNKLAYEALETRRFVARHDIEGFRPNPHFPVNTLLIMRGAIAAGDLGVFDSYLTAVFAAMWEKGRKMDDPAVARAAFAEAGLPADDLIRLTADNTVKARLLANTNAAVEHGVFGSPSFMARGEIWFGKDRLRDLEEALTL